MGRFDIDRLFDDLGIEKDAPEEAASDAQPKSSIADGESAENTISTPEGELSAAPITMHPDAGESDTESSSHEILQVVAEIEQSAEAIQSELETAELQEPSLGDAFSDSEDSEEISPKCDSEFDGTGDDHNCDRDEGGIAFDLGVEDTGEITSLEAYSGPSSADPRSVWADSSAAPIDQDADEENESSSTQAMLTSEDARTSDAQPEEDTTDSKGVILSQGLELNDTTSAFVRSDPNEHTPRPPDSNGSGLDSEVGMDQVVETDDPNRLCPTDALTPIWTPDENDSGTTVDLGEKLQENGHITGMQLETARGLIRQTPGKELAHVLAEAGVDEVCIQKVVADQNGLPFERVDMEDGIHQKMLDTLGHEYCRANSILPLRKENRRVILGMVSCNDVFLLDEVRRRLGGVSISPVVVTMQDIALAIEMQTEEEVLDSGLDDLLAEVAEDDVEVVKEDHDDVDFEKEAGESPVIRYVNYIIQSAMKDGASDIHIEPGETKVKIRFRVDGILFERMNPIAKMHAAIISRLKIMANLDISERRQPQDGRIRAVVGGRKLDLRVSTLPTVAGEKCVIRILDSRSISVGLEQLGFGEDALTIWQNQIKNPHGIILVTGPTGSGKTTTLYSSLREMDTARLNISTVEDPVEYHLANVTQVQTHAKINFTFATALRSLLRQDPDVVMVGEIRDLETAKMAVQASLTGHLVLSTLHTNDAPSSVTRLINIGVEPFLIGTALNAVLAQRLVRRICEKCKKPQELDGEMADFIAMLGQSSADVSFGEGCEHCRQTGYAGRVGLYELLVLDDVMRDLVAGNPNVTEFRRTCIERGMVSLRQDGMYKVGLGRTTIEEVMRVTEATI